MTEHSAHTTFPPVRIAALILSGLEVAAGLGFIALLNLPPSNDPLGRSIALGMTGILAVPLLLFALPALVLAVRNARLNLALILAVVALPVGFLAWRLA